MLQLYQCFFVWYQIEALLAGGETQASVTVLANDSPYGVVMWNVTALTTMEPDGTDKIVTLTITREQGLQGELRVSYV